MHGPPPCRYFPPKFFPEWDAAVAEPVIIPGGAAVRKPWSEEESLGFSGGGTKGVGFELSLEGWVRKWSPGLQRSC